MNFEDIVTKRVLADLAIFEGANHNDPAVCSSINTTTMMALVDIQDDYPEFDAKATFEFDPEVKISILWWIGVQGKQSTFNIKFNPLRIDREQKDLYSAYDRAMSIL